MLVGRWAIYAFDTREGHIGLAQPRMDGNRPRGAEVMRPRIDEIVDEAFDGMDPSQPFDIVSCLATTLMRSHHACHSGTRGSSSPGDR